MKEGTWISRLTITDVKGYDEGRYRFTAKAGYAKASAKKIVYVSKKSGNKQRQVLGNKTEISSALRINISSLIIVASNVLVSWLYCQ